MILDKIVKYKKQEIISYKKQTSIIDLEHSISNLPPTKSFYQALKMPGVRLIAEVKKASPSKGVIRANFDPLEIATTYTKNGASAISVLTDAEFFQGHPDYLTQIRTITDLPLLRKEFIIDPIQIYQARLLGADAILLIAAILSDAELVALAKIASELGLQCLVEVHTAAELQRVLKTEANIIGINNRDLTTFKTDINTTFSLSQMITDPSIAIVSESGINTRADVKMMSLNKIDGILVGEALVREPDIAQKMQELLR